MAGAGISLRLKAVQVINLVAGGGGTGESYGFGEEDGYVAPKAATNEAVDTDAEEDEDF